MMHGNSFFSQKGRAMDGLLPTQAAIVEHTRRAAYQADHIWAQMFVTIPNIPPPSEWGWLLTMMEGGKRNGHHFLRLLESAVNC